MLAALLLLPSPESSVDRLLLLLQTRLTIATEVAMAKHNSGAAVEDLPREEAVLKAVEKEAPERGVRPEEARRLFAAQIEASKAAQRRMLEIWRTLPPLTTAPDLAKDVRPKLDALTPAILDAYAEARPHFAFVSDRAALVNRFAPAFEKEWRISVAPLNQS
ncbi:gamma subclass chorismate mutase AroQ [bacterium]|nr:MAG: gamma subclass chorismate mutase AroQ [bacterium]